MKVAIIEADHFQYGLTQAAIFEGQELLFFVTQSINDKMHQYQPDLCKGRFFIIDNLTSGCDQIINVCREEKIDLLMLSPVFKGFEAVLRIAQEITCKKVITIHNLNFWLNSRFRTPGAYKERKIKQRIVKSFDYIAVEDFIYNHLKHHDKKTFEAYKFLYIPFTIYNENRTKKYSKTSDTLKIVLPGSIHKDRRRYENTIEVINHFAKNNAEITFSFAGKALEDYGSVSYTHLYR